jgi:hypothetical protein
VDISSCITTSVPRKQTHIDVPIGPLPTCWCRPVLSHAGHRRRVRNCIGHAKMSLVCLISVASCLRQRSESWRPSHEGQTRDKQAQTGSFKSRLAPLRAPCPRPSSGCISSPASLKTRTRRLAFVTPDVPPLCPSTTLASSYPHAGRRTRPLRPSRKYMITSFFHQRLTSMRSLVPTGQRCRRGRQRARAVVDRVEHARAGTCVPAQRAARPPAPTNTKRACTARRHARRPRARPRPPCTTLPRLQPRLYVHLRPCYGDWLLTCPCSCPALCRSARLSFTSAPPPSPLPASSRISLAAKLLLLNADVSLLRLRASH